MKFSMVAPVRIALLLASVMFGGCFQDAFYYPDRVLYSSPKDFGLAFEKVEFPSSDGRRLSGWFIPASEYKNPKDAKATLIQFHGNAQNISSHWQFLAWLPQRGFNVFAFDYRGYGESEGKPEPKGVFEDSDSALNYVRSRPDVNPQRLIILGQSLGGANAIAVVGSGNRSGVRALAIESTFYSYFSIANDKFPGAGFFVDDRYSAANFVERLAPIPVLFLHGSADSVIPYAHSVRLFEKAGEPKKMITINGGEHLQTLGSSEYQQALLSFYEGALGHP